MYFIGLDVHKKTISFCVKDAAVAKKIAAMLIPMAKASSRWPSLRELGEELQKRWIAIKGSACVGVLADSATWVETVPMAAASSELVAGALVLAFKLRRP